MLDLLYILIGAAFLVGASSTPTPATGCEDQSMLSNTSSAARDARPARLSRLRAAAPGTF